MPSWWLVELSYWVTASFSLKIFGIFTIQNANDNFIWDEIQPTWNQIEY